MTIAPILEQSSGKICFGVDDVERTTTLLNTQSATVQLKQNCDRELLAYSHSQDLQLIPDTQIHPLLSAVHAAFSEHRPLQLTPDLIWITLAQGFAHHINNNAETLRSRFVRHQDKEKLTVMGGELPTKAQVWAEKIDEWVLQIRDRVGVDCYRLLECNFSTTTPISRTVSHVVMMDAFQEYFDFAMICICGIPQVTLLGTVEDWQSIRDRISVMAQYDLEWWTARMFPICDEFIATASGKPSLEFWKCIYKPAHVYGAKLITGWLTDLFPYLRDGTTKASTDRNPLLTMDRCELPETDNRRSFHRRNGIAPKRMPLGLSMVPITFKISDTGQDYPLELVAGFIGVSQDAQNLTLQPELGWIVRSGDRWADLLDRIQQEHLTNAPIDWEKSSIRSISKGLIQMLERFDGGTLYADSGHSWRIIPSRHWEIQCVVPNESVPEWFIKYLDPFIRLEDGRLILFASAGKKSKNKFFLYEMGDEPTYPIVIAEGLVELFDRIFTADGAYYFD